MSLDINGIFEAITIDGLVLCPKVIDSLPSSSGRASTVGHRPLPVIRI